MKLARWGPPLLVSGTAVTAISYGAALFPGEAPMWSAAGLAVGIGLLLSGLLLLGARRNGQVPTGLAVVFILTGFWVSGGLLALLLLPGLDPPDASLVLGLPRRAAFLLLGLGLAPALLVPVAYGLVFDRETLSEGDLERLRKVAERVRNERAPGHGAPPRGSTPSEDGGA